MTPVQYRQDAGLKSSTTGVSSLADLEAFLPHESDGVAGVIAGRAIYDGQIDLAAALARLREAA